MPYLFAMKAPPLSRQALLGLNTDVDQEIYGRLSLAYRWVGCTEGDREGLTEPSFEFF